MVGEQARLCAHFPSRSEKPNWTDATPSVSLPGYTQRAPEASAETGGAFHRFHEILLQKGLSYEGKFTALPFPPG